MAKYFDEITKNQLMQHILFEDTDGYQGTDLGGWIDDEIELVEEGDEVIEHKAVFWQNVYRHSLTDTFYCVQSSRANSEYWGDSERYDSEVNEVKRVVKIVEQVTWKAV